METPDSKPEMNSGVIKVGLTEVDLTRLQPMTLADKRRLFKLGVDLSKMREFTPEEDAKMLLYILQRLDPQITDEQASDLPLKVAEAVMRRFGAVTENVDVPFGRRSTPLAGTTDGDRSKSVS